MPAASASARRIRIVYFLLEQQPQQLEPFSVGPPQQQHTPVVRWSFVMCLFYTFKPA